MPVRSSWKVFVAIAVLLAGCAHGRDTATVQPGDLLTAQPLTSAAALPSAASNRLITYVSEDPHGQPIVVSGTVSVPKSPAPPGGWPVISFAHGTTGYATGCAPSADFVGGPVHDYVSVMTPTLNRWVADGYAVVVADYQGLGTPGGSPYGNGASEAHNVSDIVRAARRLDSSIGTDWVAIGHSQGGQAALFTAADAQRGAPELHLKGAVSIAPGSDFGHTVDFVESGQPGAEAAEPFLPLLVLGAAVADPRVDPANVFAAEFVPFVDAARTRCAHALRELAPIPNNRVFAPGADLRPLTDYLAGQDPAVITPAVPLLIVQGGADTTVAPAMTDALVQTYCGKRVALDYRTYPGMDHRPVVAASFDDARAFVGDVLDGRPTANTCASR